jgi:hypothetical protein
MSLRERTGLELGIIEPCLRSPAKALPSGAIGFSTMLRITIYATLIAIVMVGAASAQTDEPGLPGYRNSLRTNQEKKNDREIDRAYESTIKGRPDVK